MELTPIELRVLGSLMEKARTTPEVYPLTLNSLVHACNQKTSRDPVTDYDEAEVLAALDSLRAKHLVMRVDMAGSRTAKFRENASEHWQLKPEEYALLTPLFLRGPQTPGQLRQRSERLHLFAELQQVIDWLHRLEQREDEPHRMVRALPRQAGTKEIRYGHTLCPLEEQAAPVPEPLPETMPAIPAAHSPQSAPVVSREAELETRLEALEQKVAELEQLIHDLTS